jgi:hypothetical protein
MDFAFFRSDDAAAAALAEQILAEGRTYQVDNRWSAHVDRSHADPTTTHNHVQFNARDVAIVNRNGTSSHNSDLSKIPNWMMAWMKNKGLTESYLLAEASATWERVPPAVIEFAVRYEETMARAVEHLNRTGGASSS